MEHLDAALEKARAMRDTMAAAQQAGGISLIEVLLARRTYQELLHERIDVNGDAFRAALTIRKLLGQFPQLDQVDRLPDEAN